MRVELKGVSKRFRMEWVLRQVDLVFEPGKRYAVTGPNGSGKSTLLKILSGHLTPSQGKINFSLQGQALEVANVYEHLSYAAPYIELLEELTLLESLQFHTRFKPLSSGLDASAVVELLGFERARHKPVRNFSSGMKQRLKLALALCSATPFLLLDEPTTNLDQEGVAWYRRLVEAYAPGRLLIIASNAEVDFDFCEERVSILDWKGAGGK
jgi:ABC-2 type transport system ATP-binding protein